MVMAFNDINPIAPIHIILIPKNQYISLDDFTKNASPAEIAHIFKVAGNIGRGNPTLQETGYRIITNNGKEAGQTVFHFHLHIIGGNNMKESSM